MQLLFFVLLLLLIGTDAQLSFQRARKIWSYRDRGFCIAKQDQLLTNKVEHMKPHLNYFTNSVEFGLTARVGDRYTLSLAHRYLQFTPEDFSDLTLTSAAHRSDIFLTRSDWSNVVRAIFYQRNGTETVVQSGVNLWSTEPIRVPAPLSLVLDEDQYLDRVVLTMPEASSPPPPPEPYQQNTPRGGAKPDKSEEESSWKDKIPNLRKSGLSSVRFFHNFLQKERSTSPSTFTATPSRKRKRSPSLGKRVKRLFATSGSLSSADEEETPGHSRSGQLPAEIPVRFKKTLDWADEHTGVENTPFEKSIIDLNKFLDKGWVITGPQMMYQMRYSANYRTSMKERAGQNLQVVAMSVGPEAEVETESSQEEVHGTTRQKQPQIYMIHSYSPLSTNVMMQEMRGNNLEIGRPDPVNYTVLLHNIQSFPVSEESKRSGFRLHVKWTPKQLTPLPDNLFNRKDKANQIALVVFNNIRENTSALNEVSYSTAYVPWEDNLAMDLPSQPGPLRYAVLFQHVSQPFLNNLLNNYDLHAWEEPLGSTFTYHYG